MTRGSSAGPSSVVAWPWASGAGCRRGHRGSLSFVLRQAPPRRTVRGRRGLARGVGPLHRPDAGARGAGRVVRQVEVLAQREALVVGRHVDAAQVAVALERDAEHVVGLALHPLGALPHERDRRDARVVARQAVGDDPQPVRRRGAPQVVDDLHDLARVDAGQVGEELEPELGLVVERGDDLGHVARPDADLGLVVALADGPGQLLAEAALQAGLERAVHGQTCSGTVGPIGPLRPMAAPVLDELLELHHPVDEALRAGAGSPGRRRRPA